jgi:hypothetical protein
MRNRSLPLVLLPAVAAAALERLEEELSERRYPATFPAHGPLRLDLDGNLWVQDYPVPGSEVPHRWSVFDPEGYWLGLVETPKHLTIREIGGDYMLGTTRDEPDVVYVVVHKLTKAVDAAEVTR